MKFTVGWKDTETGKMKREHAKVVEAVDNYEAGCKWLDERVMGTALEKCRRKEQFRFIRIKRVDDKRVPKPVMPEDFNLDDFIEELNDKGEVPVDA